MWDFLTNATTLELVIWAFFIGALIGAVSMFYQKRIIGAYVRALMEAGANDISNAVSLEQMGYGKNPIIRRALRDGSVLRKMVWEADDNYTEDETGVLYSARSKKMDINTARFYIDERNRVKADLRYNANGTDVITLLIAIVVFFVAAYALLLFVPYIINMFTDVFSG